MLSVKIDGKQFGIAFTHSKFQPVAKDLTKTQRKKLLKRRQTECFIYELDVQDGHFARLEIGYGLAPCSIEDNFCKETGRATSLEKALKNAIKRGHPLFTVDHAGHPDPGEETCPECLKKAGEVRRVQYEFFFQYLAKVPVSLTSVPK